MKPCDLVINGGDVLDLSAPASVRVDHAVAVLDGRIVDVAPTTQIAFDWRPIREINARGAVIAPGFVDAHIHLSAFLMTPMHHQRAVGPSLFGGAAPPADLLTMVARMTSVPVPVELVATVLRPVFAALLAAGFTSVVDAGSSGHDGIIDAAVQTGIRLATGPSLADMWSQDGEISRRADPDLLLEAARDFVGRHDRAGGGRIRAMVSAVEPTACSDDLLRGLAQLATEADIPTHIHCLIDQESEELHRLVHGCEAIDRLTATGLLSPNCTAMHVGTADDRAVEILRIFGATVNHNPLGNTMLGWNTMRHQAVPKLLAAGVPIVLGSDYSPSMIPTPFDLMHAALAANREAGATDDALVLEDVVAMATNAGAVMGQPGQLGEIKAGQLADLVVIDTSPPHHLGSRHPIPSVALRGRSSDVRTVIVAGQIVVDDGVVTIVDTEIAGAAADEALRSLSS